MLLDYTRENILLNTMESEKKKKNLMHFGLTFIFFKFKKMISRLRTSDYAFYSSFALLCVIETYILHCRRNVSAIIKWSFQTFKFKSRKYKEHIAMKFKWQPNITFPSKKDACGCLFIELCKRALIYFYLEFL